MYFVKLEHIDLSDYTAREESPGSRHPVESNLKLYRIRARDALIYCTRLHSSSESR